MSSNYESGISESTAIQLDDFTCELHNHSGELTDRDKDILCQMAQQLADTIEKKSPPIDFEQKIKKTRGADPGAEDQAI